MRSQILLILIVLNISSNAQTIIYFRSLVDTLKVGKIELRSDITMSLDSAGRGSGSGDFRVVSISDSSITIREVSKANNEQILFKNYKRVSLGYNHGEGFYLIGGLAMLVGIGAIGASPVVLATGHGDEAGETLLVGGIALVGGFILCLPRMLANGYDLTIWKSVSFEEYKHVKKLKRQLKREK